MPRRARFAAGNWIYHVHNRANGRDRLFDDEESYRDFLHILSECADEMGMRVLAWCAMPNHWHLLLWPRTDEDLSRFLHQLTSRHTQRWHRRNGTAGRGHLYQARFKSFAVQGDAHLLTVCRYIEQNPLRAGLVQDMYEWPWSSAGQRWEPRRRSVVKLEPLPCGVPDELRSWWSLNESEGALKNVREHVAKGTPFGSPEFSARIDPPRAPRPRGRPRITKIGNSEQRDGKRRARNNMSR